MYRSARPRATCPFSFPSLLPEHATSSLSLLFHADSCPDPSGQRRRRPFSPFLSAGSDDRLGFSPRRQNRMACCPVRGPTYHAVSLPPHLPTDRAARPPSQAPYLSFPLLACKKGVQAAVAPHEVVLLSGFVDSDGAGSTYRISLTFVVIGVSMPAMKRLLMFLLECQCWKLLMGHIT